MAWMKSPETNLTTEYGGIRAAFTSGTRVYAEIGGETGHAHHNDSRPAFTFREREYLGSVHLTITDGMVTADMADHYISQRGAIGGKAPRTYAEKMITAIITAVQTYVDANPDTLRAAEYVHLNNDLDRETETRDKLAGELAAADKVVADLAAALDKVRPAE
jgi:hypothetical protein